MSSVTSTPSPPAQSASQLLLKINGLKVEFPTDDGLVTAVHDVSFSINRGQAVGLVGESGCGKSMTGLALLRLIPRPGRIAAGQINFTPRVDEPSVEIVGMEQNGTAVRALRGNEIAMIFQEPMSSLNPVYTIGDQIGEAVMLHRNVGKKEARERAIEMLNRVGMPAPKLRVDEYPHQLSGGMRQRAMIALALSCDPRLLIADEPTTALDVTVQAQIVDLMRDLQQEMGMAILMISHDLGVIADICDQVVVMYAGRVVEQGTSDDVFYNPKHPYTRGLLKSAPVLGGNVGARLFAIPGSVPDPLAMPKGCSFHPRCNERFSACVQMPDLIELAPGHWGRCWARIKEVDNGNLAK
jgi:oligopeptide/dipeptide ABC transporter ATP-binding protein